MDELIGAVQSQVFELSNLDAMVEYSGINYVFIYENKDGSDEFMPFEVLKQSLYKTLYQFPILVGYIREVDHGKYSVIVDKDNLNLPEYRESVSGTHYSELKSAGFSWNKWPKDMRINPFVDLDKSGYIKSAVVDVVRLKGNSGLIVSLGLPHCLVDGKGYFTFVNLWADIAKEMRGKTAASSRCPKTPVSDRNALKSSIPVERKPLDAGTRWFYTHSSMVSRFWAWMSLETRVGLLTSLTSKVEGEPHVFHISRKALERMHLSVREFVAGDMHISDNDLLSALLYKTFAQSEAAATDGSGSIAKMALSILKPLASYVFGVREMVVSLACDTRPRLGIMDLNYMGNATITTFTKYRSAELATPTTAESLAGVAMQVRQLVNSVDGAYIGSLMDAVDSNPSLNTQIIGCTSMYPTLVLSNHSRLSMYNADFGDGVQQWTSFVPGLKSGVGFIQSCPPCKDGVNVFVEAPVKIMKSMLMNEYWMDVAELVY